MARALYLRVREDEVEETLDLAEREFGTHGDVAFAGNVSRDRGSLLRGAGGAYNPLRPHLGDSRAPRGLYLTSGVDKSRPRSRERRSS